VGPKCIIGYENAFAFEINLENLRLKLKYNYDIYAIVE